MATAKNGKEKTRRAGHASSATGRPKKAKPRSFRLDSKLLAKVRRLLGTPNDTATIEAALDLVIFRKEVAAGIRNLAGVQITSPDEGVAPPPWRSESP